MPVSSQLVTVARIQLAAIEPDERPVEGKLYGRHRCCRQTQKDPDHVDKRHRNLWRGDTGEQPVSRKVPLSPKMARLHSANRNFKYVVK